jgi:hypothetical protein
VAIGQQIDDFPLGFITPLQADHGGGSHDGSLSTLKIGSSSPFSRAQKNRRVGFEIALGTNRRRSNDYIRPESEWGAIASRT